MSHMECRKESLFNGDFQENLQLLQKKCKNIKTGKEKSSDCLPKLLDDYFEKIRTLVMELDKDKASNPLLESELESWLFGIDKIYINQEKSISDAVHPVALMNDWYYQETKKETEGIKNKIQQEVTDSILSNKYRNRQKINLHLWGNDYKVDIKNNKLLKFEDYGTLTSIQETRLIEKIESLYKKLGKQDLRIAYFGELELNGEDSEKYFQRKNNIGYDNIVLEKYQHEDEELFLGQNQRYINLRDSAELASFLCAYDMILFLDESYFYRKNQSHKTSREENRALYVDYYWNMAKQYKNKQDKNESLELINIYFSMYEEAEKFLMGKYSPMSSEYEFDENLIKRIQAIVDQQEKGCADIYFYINNSKVADKNIDSLNVCKEEYYDGKNIIVYKIDGKWDKQKEEELSNSDSPRNDGTATIATVELWKLIKSISNKYYSEKWSDCNIWELKNIYVIFLKGEIVNKELDKFEISYYIYTKGDVASDKVNRASEFMESVFSMIGEENILGCVKRYLRRLVSDAILSKADNVEGLLLAYFLMKKDDIVFKKCAEPEMGEIIPENSNMSYKERKAVYTIIENLDNYIIRDLQQLRQSLFYGFKLKYVKEMSDEVFEEYLSKIYSACQKMKDCKSRLYLYSEMIQR